jgi:hypothetical protein
MQNFEETAKPVENRPETPEYRPWTAAQLADLAIKLYGHPPGWTSLPGDEWVRAGGPYVVNLSAIRRFYEAAERRMLP